MTRRSVYQAHQRTVDASGHLLLPRGQHHPSRTRGVDLGSAFGLPAVGNRTTAASRRAVRIVKKIRRLPLGQGAKYGSVAPFVVELIPKEYVLDYDWCRQLI